MQPGFYKMKISRLTVDKLGMKLYDRVSAVIAELVSNSYDADATEVVITAPMGEYLATKNMGVLHDKGHVIEVKDNGIGMTPDEINAFYLVVGKERRLDERRGDLSRRFKRKVMGRKGVGKLAPFGVCQKIEIISAGGDKIEGQNRNGKSARGYLTAHLILDRAGILEDTDTQYEPAVGRLDGTVSESSGTTIILSQFDRRQVPTIESFDRQLARRFGLSTPNWSVVLLDSLKTESDPDRRRILANFDVEMMENTCIRLASVNGAQNGSRNLEDYKVIEPDGRIADGMTAGFSFEGKFYPNIGWVAYSKQPYKDDLMAGVRIYCRGKIAAQTHIFNMKAGFTGEYDIRSYLIGEIHADWLDEEEDLIQTDRQDILWSHELGQAFESWGQKLIKRIGTISREPQRKRSWELFKEKSKIEEKVAKSFPAADQEKIREDTIQIAKTIAQTTRDEELKDDSQVESLLQLSMLLGPNITLDHKLREAAESKHNPLSVISEILRVARVAELAGFGRIADRRIAVIKELEKLKDDEHTEEASFQKLITAAPWLINPQWAPIVANQSFSTLKTEFEKYFKQRTGQDIALNDFSNPGKRPDFVISSQGSTIHIIEIKRPQHTLQNEEMNRINTYMEIMVDFFNIPGNAEFKKEFPDFHLTLVCDKIGLTGVYKTAFVSFIGKGDMDHITWTAFLLRTRKMHEEFLNEAEKQKRKSA